MERRFKSEFLSDKKIVSEERKQEIAKKFKESVGILNEEDVADLDTLPIREVFDLLSGWKKAALHYLYKFPREETVDLMLELGGQKEFSSFSDQKTISWILGEFLHHPETFSKVVEVLKEKRDPRVIQETEKGVIEMADQIGMVDEICLMDDSLEKNRIPFEKYTKNGEMFIYRDKSKKLVCFAAANRMDNYTLYVNYIFTEANERKKGYGEEMLKYLIDQHEVLETDLFRGNMLSENVLKKLGFKKDEHGERWIHRKANPA